ncbi:MAG: exodeoxyribonuclease VII large subunit [Baekduia sp.]
MSDDPALETGSAGGAPEGIDGIELSGPFAVGRYAAFLRDRFKEIARVQLFGEVWNLRRSKAKVYFELRDGDGSVPCSIWARDFDRLGLPEGSPGDGDRIVVAGGPSYYPGSRTSSPAFSFDVSAIRLAGEGDLLAQLAALQRVLDAEGLFAPQKTLPRPALPRTIGVITGEGGKARDDVLAGLRRRGWAGTIVWAFAPVQDRHAAPRITAALQDLAAAPEIDVIIVARGGGSLADLFAFCDETLCRTVAMLRVPVIASVGHHTDRTLIDDVAAVSCSTPTHAAEAAVPVDVGEARASLLRSGLALERGAGAAILGRARTLAMMSRAPAQAAERHRGALHQRLREIRASSRRTIDGGRENTRRAALVIGRKAAAAAGPERRSAEQRLTGLAAALAAHDPERTVARGYAIVDDGSGNVITSAVQARATGAVRLFFGDGAAGATVDPEPPANREDHE